MAGFMILMLFLVGVLVSLTEIIQTQALKNKLDRIAYSVTGVLRERTRLYHQQENITQTQVDDLAALAKSMLPRAQGDDLITTVEELHFESIDPSHPNRKIPKTDNKRFNDSTNAQTCTTTTEQLQDQMYLAPKSHRPRWVPLYKVNLCLPMRSWLPGNTEQIKSYAIMVSR